MLKKIIPYCIICQFGVGLFHLGIGINEWLATSYFHLESLLILFLSLGTTSIYFRYKNVTIVERSLSMVFEQAFLLGLGSWFFYKTWGYEWEIFLIIFTSCSLIGLIITKILETQFHMNILGDTGGATLPLWRLGLFISLVNTLTVPFFLIILHENLSLIWLIFGVSWLFFWKVEV